MVALLTRPWESTRSNKLHAAELLSNYVFSRARWMLAARQLNKSIRMGFVLWFLVQAADCTGMRDIVPATLCVFSLCSFFFFVCLFDL